MILEICANSYQSALNAKNAGAHRIELCSELSVGGITPSHGLIEKVMTELNIPTFVLIRPRSGNFIYSKDEFDIMKKDISYCKEIGAQGIVSGVLNDDHTLDKIRTEELIALSRPMSFTFHRAFDCVADPFKTMGDLIDIKADRVLSSGQEKKAEDGLLLLKQLHSLYGNKITIVPGSGINPKNVKLFTSHGFKEIHSSASKALANDKESLFGKAGESVSEPKTIRELLKHIYAI